MFRHLSFTPPPSLCAASTPRLRFGGCKFRRQPLKLRLLRRRGRRAPCSGGIEMSRRLKEELVVGENPGSKRAKAQDLGITILDEGELLRLLGMEPEGQS